MKTPEAVVFSFLFERIKSIRVDFDGSFKFSLVGSLISCDRLKFTHNSFKLDDSLDNQFWFRSPRMSSSDFSIRASESAKAPIAPGTADGGL